MFGGLCCASTSAGLSDYLWMVLSHGAAAAVDLLPFHSSSSSSCLLLLLLLQELFRFVVIRRRRLAETLLAVEFALWRDMAWRPLLSSTFP